MVVTVNPLKPTRKETFSPRLPSSFPPTPFLLLLHQIMRFPSFAVLVTSAMVSAQQVLFEPHQLELAVKHVL
jgi:hypothetical protein